MFAYRPARPPVPITPFPGSPPESFAAYNKAWAEHQSRLMQDFKVAMVEMAIWFGACFVMIAALLFL